jgi:hypothetical protein
VDPTFYCQEMKNAVCDCGYVFPIVRFVAVGITFTYGQRGRIFQICPQCSKEHEVIVMAPTGDDRDPVLQ